MKAVFEHIERRAEELGAHPLFVHLHDESVDPAERLQFVPCVAHFVMTFADLCGFFLVDDAPKDDYAKLTNENLREEGPHWRWFLADLSTLGLDPSLRFTDALRFLFSDATMRTRSVAYSICKWSAGLNSVERLALVHGIEATARVALESVAPIADRVAARTGRTLVYFGSHHVETERNHTLKDDEVQKTLEETVLEPAVREKLIGLIDRVFEAFVGLLDDAYAFAKERKSLEQVVATEAASLAS